MNILILNNNNLPESLSEQLISIDKDLSIDSKNYIELQFGKSNFDHYVHNELSRIFKDKPTFDLIILPYSFSSENYMELTGLTTALHIRLTQKWGQTRVPLLFVGPDPKEEIERFSSYGILLETSCVYTTQDNEGSKVYSLIQTLRLHRMSEEQYHVFLNRIKVERPSNYPTHHSIANDWCLMKWKNLLIWPNGNMPAYSDDHFDSMLYLKYIMAVNSFVNEEVTGERKNHNSVEAKIPNIKGKRICLIDDQYNRGWGEFFKIVLDNSEADFRPYTDFNLSYGRDELVKHIKQYIDNNDTNIDVYILDLRLHESDTYAQPENLTGHEIAEYIHQANAANQIIILTASNKVWNYQKDMDECHAYGYVVKESPEIHNTTAQSIENFQKLSSKVEESAFLSYFKEFSSILKDKGISEASLLAIEELFVTEKSVNKEVTLGTIVVNLVEFVKCHLNSLYKLKSLEILRKSDSSVIENISGKVYRKSIIVDDHPQTINITFSDTVITQPTDMENPKQGDIDSIALYYCYNVREPICNLYLKAKYERNTSLAHHGGKSSLTKQELKNLIRNVLIPILNKDY